MVLKRGRKRQTNIDILQTKLRELAPLHKTPTDTANVYEESGSKAEGLKIVEEIKKPVKKKGLKKDAVINTKMLLT